MSAIEEEVEAQLLPFRKAIEELEKDDRLKSA